MSNTLLRKDRAKEIEQLVLGLSENFGEEDTADLLIAIAKCNGIELKQSDLREMSGVLTKREGKWAIIVNKNDSRTRQLFTIAHELGHYFLHKDDQEEFVDGGFFGRVETTKFRLNELEANEFAGCLIMPRVKIESEIGRPNKPSKTLGYEKIYLLADKFGVSTTAMSTRLKNLDYRVHG